MSAAAPGAAGFVRFRENGFVRKTPSAAGAVLGVMKRGATLPFGGVASPAGWLAVTYRGAPGWVSGKFVRVISPSRRDPS